MTLRQQLIASLRHVGWFPTGVGLAVAADDPYGLNAALAERKRNRDTYRAQERSQASLKGWETRRGRGA